MASAMIHFKNLLKFMLGLAKYLVYCLTVIWLNKKNIVHLPRYFSQLFWSNSSTYGWIRTAAFIAIPLVALFGCEDFDAPKEETEIVTPDGDSDDDSNSSSRSRSSDIDAGDMDASDEEADAADDEEEETPEQSTLKNDYVVAQATEDFIFVPNPRNHCVTMIYPEAIIEGKPNIYKCLKCDSKDTDECIGKEPTYLGVYRGLKNKAIVIDKAENRATIIEASPSNEIITNLDIVPNANAVQFVPGGKYAILYHSPEHAGGDGEEALGGHQNISVIDTEEKTVTNMVVGLRPKELILDSREKAIFITEEGISVIRFLDIDGEDSSAFAKSADFHGKIDPSVANIEIAPGGRYAYGYTPGSSELFQLDISSEIESAQSESTTEILATLNMELFFLTGESSEGGDSSNNNSDQDDAGTPDDDDSDDGEEEIDPRPVLPEDVVPGIADVAVSPSSVGSYILVTIPNPGLVLKLDIKDAFEADEDDVLDYAGFYLINEQYDSIEISSDGETALVFNRTEQAPWITLLTDLNGEKPPAVADEDWEDWSKNHIKKIKLAHPIEKAEFINGDQTIIITHPTEDNPINSNGKYGYTLIDVKARMPWIQDTARPHNTYIDYKKSLFVSVPEKDLSRSELQITDLKTLHFKTLSLNGIPNTMGTFTDADVNRFFISYQHPNGHIVLLDNKGTSITKPLIGFQIIDRVQEQE